MGSARTNHQVDYEETLNDILQTLTQIKQGRTGGLTGTFWEAKYKQDITFLLKRLAEKNARFKTMADHVRKAYEVLDKPAQ